MGALQREVGRMYRGMRAQQREQQGGGGGGGGPTWEDAFAKVSTHRSVAYSVRKPDGINITECTGPL